MAVLRISFSQMAPLRISTVGWPQISRRNFPLRMHRAVMIPWQTISAIMGTSP